MMRRLLSLAGVTTVALGLAYLAWPVGHIPAYDANLVRLAENDLEGYCSGDAFWRSNGQGSASLAQDCRVRLRGKRSDRPNLAAVQPAFCAAIVDDGWTGGTADDCVAILANGQYWPTYDGNITNAWNRARPYPRLFNLANPSSGSDGSRTGGHSGSERTNNPTHSVPIYP